MKLSRTKTEKLMFLKGWGQNELAEQSTVSRATISLFMNGKNITPKSAHKLANALGVGVMDILEEEGAGK